jgi:hypothetical protein
LTQLKSTCKCIFENAIYLIFSHLFRACSEFLGLIFATKKSFSCGISTAWKKDVTVSQDLTGGSLSLTVELHETICKEIDLKRVKSPVSVKVNDLEYPVQMKVNHKLLGKLSGRISSCTAECRINPFNADKAKVEIHILSCPWEETMFNHQTTNLQQQQSSKLLTRFKIDQSKARSKIEQKMEEDKAKLTNELLNKALIEEVRTRRILVAERRFQGSSSSLSYIQKVESFYGQGNGLLWLIKIDRWLTSFQSNALKKLQELQVHPFLEALFDKNMFSELPLQSKADSLMQIHNMLEDHEPNYLDSFPQSSKFKYLIENIARICKSDCLPTYEDISQFGNGVIQEISLKIEGDKYSLCISTQENNERIGKTLTGIIDVAFCFAVFIDLANFDQFVGYDEPFMSAVFSSFEVFCRAFRKNHDPQVLIFIIGKDDFANRVQNDDYSVSQIFPDITFTEQDRFETIRIFVEKKLSEIAGGSGITDRPRTFWLSSPVDFPKEFWMGIRDIITKRALRSSGLDILGL